MYPCHICTGTGTHPCHICNRTAAHACHICTGTGTPSSARSSECFALSERSSPRAQSACVRAAGHFHRERGRRRCVHRQSQAHSLGVCASSPQGRRAVAGVPEAVDAVAHDVSIGGPRALPALSAAATCRSCRRRRCAPRWRKGGTGPLAPRRLGSRGPVSLPEYVRARVRAGTCRADAPTGAVRACRSSCRRRSSSRTTSRSPGTSSRCTRRSSSHLRRRHCGTHASTERARARCAALRTHRLQGRRAHVSLCVWISTASFQGRKARVKQQQSMFTELRKARLSAAPSVAACTAYHRTACRRYPPSRARSGMNMPRVT